MASGIGFNETIPNATNPGIRTAQQRHRVETARDFLRIVRIAKRVWFD
jgi:hypothetical protein